MVVFIGWFALYFLVGIVLLVGIWKVRLQKTISFQSIESLSVIIPFRNEYSNLANFIDCIRKQRAQPNEWIFVNDHSDDSFQELFSDLSDLPIRLIHLSETVHGKKQAIRSGIQQINTDYFLTMDADVTFGENYIHSLLDSNQLNSDSKLFILPVVMKSKSWWQTFFQVEYAFTQVLNKGMSGLFRPILCSGANLLIHKTSFEQVDDLANHIHQSSGDDVYTLRAFRNNNLPISICDQEDLTVTTNTPSSIVETLNQRSRWASKSKDVGDSLSNGIAIFSVITHFIYFSLAFICFVKGFWWMFFALFGYKFIFDLWLYQTAGNRISKNGLLGLLLFELFYPFYLVVLFGWMLLKKTKWKGREIIHK